MQLDFFEAANPNGSGVLVLPGGAYRFVSHDNEGNPPAKWLNEHGFHAWVLTYTVASEEKPGPIYPTPLNEALDAIQQIRVQKDHPVKRLGIWGFSAGGHLAAVTATNPEANLDFAILAYSVISMEPGTTHAESRRNLIGEHPDPKLQHDMSAQNWVSDKTPPCFLFHTCTDDCVPVANTMLFANAMARCERPFELLILPEGGHGIGLALENERLNWMGELERWIVKFGVTSS